MGNNVLRRADAFRSVLSIFEGQELSEAPSTLQPFVSKLDGHASLNMADRQAILALPHKLSKVEPGAYLFREGQRADTCCVIVSGYACRHKIVGRGARQILSVHMQGDGIDLQNALLALTDHNIQALSRVTVALIPSAAINELIASNPNVARAMWIETLLDASIQREWTANVGRREARARVAHILCEIGLRSEVIGIGSRRKFKLPLTQEQLGDAAGLTAVHVNRVLRSFDTEELVSRNQREIAVPDWNQLADVGDFRATYLHPLPLTL
jgi:CRP-like cAMP-binding protein